MSDVSNLSDTIVPKSDQLNSEQLLGAPITITVSAVKRGSDDQPIVINYEGDNGRPYKPCKTCRKVLIFAWGDDGRQWIGRSMTLYNNPNVKFGGVMVGGIRISHLSHIDRDIALSLTATKGKKEPTMIKKLVIEGKTAERPEAPIKEEIAAAKEALKLAAKNGMKSLQGAWKTTPPLIRKAISPDGSCPDSLKAIATDADNPPAIEPEPEINDNDMF